MKMTNNESTLIGNSGDDNAIGISKIIKQPRLLGILLRYLKERDWTDIAYITENKELPDMDNEYECFNKLKSMLHLCVGDDGVSINHEFDWTLMRMIEMVNAPLSTDSTHWRFKTDEELVHILHDRPTLEIHVNEPIRDIVVVENAPRKVMRRKRDLADE